MPSSLSTHTVASVEDAFLRGEWTQALTDSRNVLAQRIVQSVFELELYGEVETAAAIADAFAPLPCGIAIQWSKFLMAMKHRPLAQEALRALLASYQPDKSVGCFNTEQYANALELLALQLLLPDEGIEAARHFVTSDGVLDDPTKLQLLRRIQAAHMVNQAASKDAERSSAPLQPHPSQLHGVGGAESSFRGTVTHSTTAGTTATRYTTAEDDDASSYVMIGGTAIAVAVVAAGALRYREKIQESVASVIPAISKSLADAKYALFDA
ncbi:hypothetical protein BBJ28_00024537 [Nothophytophthora sp. Chile5]|nr:hypothetical protein BBJ28_00024537 [Nothophytophthora sp. Chile5]